MSPRRTFEELEHEAPTLVYIAGNTPDAKKAEQVLSDALVDYAVRLDLFTTSNVLLLGGEYAGLFFYVPRRQHGPAKQLLETQGFRDTIASEDER